MLRWSNAIKKLNMRCHQLHQVSLFFAKKHQKSENEAEVERFDGQLKLTSVAKKNFFKVQQNFLHFTFFALEAEIFETEKKLLVFKNTDEDD